MILIHTLRFKMNREIALRVLVSYFKDKSYINIVLNKELESSDISKDDKNFITRVVYGTMQYQLYLNFLLQPFISGKRVKVYEKTLLLMSLYQHIYMDSIPDYAIVNEAVNLAKKQKGIKTAQFINAVLNKAFKEKRNLDGLNEIERLSIETSHPLWLVKMFIKQYGLETAKKICYSNNEVPNQTARVNTLLTTREKILENPLYKKAVRSPVGVYYIGGNIANTKEYKDGLLTVQDESSQLIAELLAPKENDKVLDMCAAPGSKTQYISELMNNTGKVLALDIHPHRVEIMKKYLTSLQLTNVTCVCYDSTKLHEKSKLIGSFDKVLLDAPCLGLGVIRRKPDIAMSLQGEKLDEIVLLQAKLLEEAYLMLKEGGTLVYSTCSINKKENDAQIMAFLGKHKDMKRVFEKQIFPFDYDSDGFYICKLIKE